MSLPPNTSLSSVSVFAAPAASGMDSLAISYSTEFTVASAFVTRARFDSRHGVAAPEVTASFGAVYAKPDEIDKPTIS